MSEESSQNQPLNAEGSIEKPDSESNAERESLSKSNDDLEHQDSSDAPYGANQAVIDNEDKATDLENPNKGPNEPSKSLNNEERLEQLEKEHETLRSQYMRIAADFDNFRKRQTRDNDDLKLQLICTTLSEILPVVDNFERARQQLEPKGEEAKALHRSYQGLYKQLVDVLKQLGVAPMRVVGLAFDPNLHEAVLREPSQEQKEDIILEELQRGYHLNGRVLRHALVKVSMGPGKSSAEEDSSMKEEEATSEGFSSNEPETPLDSNP